MSLWLENVFDTLNWKTVLITGLDVLLVYYLIYRALLTIRGTRAQQMIIGILLLMGAFFAAERLELATVSWMMDSLLKYFPIILIILFQQDIRRVLMRLGERAVPFGRTPQVAHALDEVIAAAVHLAKARIGAIVVFQRDAKLSVIAEGGEAVDAKLSKELLSSLFVPSRDNPLHDGAVILDSDLRIERAGVVLPLSRDLKLPVDMGTRHRAALGITEETDAVAIVVSEERGEISLCLKGAIARDLEKDTLRAALTDLFYPTVGAPEDVASKAQAAAEIGKAMAALAQDSGTEETTKSQSKIPVRDGA